MKWWVADSCCLWALQAWHHLKQMHIQIQGCHLGNHLNDIWVSLSAGVSSNSFECCRNWWVSYTPSGANSVGRLLSILCYLTVKYNTLNWGISVPLQAVMYVCIFSIWRVNIVIELIWIWTSEYAEGHDISTGNGIYICKDYHFFMGFYISASRLTVSYALVASVRYLTSTEMSFGSGLTCWL